MTSLTIGNLSTKLPIIQGGMGIGVSLSSLAGSVSANGGLGVISASNPGFLEKDFARNPFEANVRALSRHITTAKEIAGNAPIGVNIMVASNHYANYVQCCINAHADIIISGAGLPVDLPEIVADADIKIAPIVSSLKAAKVLLKLWDRRYHRMADMVIIEGHAAGGHLGFSSDELLSPPDMDQVCTDIKELLTTYEKKYNRPIPLVFAGGVHDRMDVAHYMDKLGLDGVQVASRFVCTKECDVHDNFKQCYLSASPQDIAIVKSPVGMPGRAIRNDFIKRAEHAQQPIGQCYQCLRKCDRQNIPYCISQALINAARGDVANGLVFCGANTHKINTMSTVANILSELTS